jgi:predicted nucleic acid-binding protein
VAGRRAPPYRPGIADHLIAATADVHGYELATLDIRHFPMIENLTAPFTP